MCGIAVLHDTSADPDHSLLAALGTPMLERLEHRGPDGTHARVVGPTWLGHTRLSIVDLQGGDQPLPDESGTRWVVCNGEIYNHEVLRDDFDGPFLTRSDSEAALHATYEGLAGVAQLRGMFAFCVAGDDGYFLAARDRLGVKPLYWAQRDDVVVLRLRAAGVRDRLAAAGRGVPARPRVDAGRRPGPLRRDHGGDPEYTSRDAGARGASARASCAACGGG